MVRRRSHGVSLAEAIIACFVLVGALVVSGTVFHTALQYSVKVDQRFVASRVAERRLEEIKSWSRNAHGTNGDLEFTDGWAAYEGVEIEDPENPGYLIRTEVKHNVPFFSPSTAFESTNVLFASQEEETTTVLESRVIESSVKQVTATARWGDGPTEQVTVTTLIGEPNKDYGFDEANAADAISITQDNGAPVPSALSINQELTLLAELRDANGQTVRRPAIEWYVDPDSTGNGTLTTRPRHPDIAQFKNVVLVNTDPENPAAVIPVHAGGRVRIAARARLGGVDVVKLTPPINLDN